MERYWFPAKRHGWGWTAPSAWQGWAVLAIFIILVTAGAILFPPGRSLLSYLAYVFVLAAALVGCCWWKGEPPGRR